MEVHLYFGQALGSAVRVVRPGRLANPFDPKRREDDLHVGYETKALLPVAACAFVQPFDTFDMAEERIAEAAIKGGKKVEELLRREMSAALARKLAGLDR